MCFGARHLFVLLLLLSMLLCRPAPGISRKRIFDGMSLLASYTLPPVLLPPETTTGNRPKARQKCTMHALICTARCLMRLPFPAGRPLQRLPHNLLVRLLRHHTGEEPDEFKPWSWNAGDVVRSLDILLLPLDFPSRCTKYPFFPATFRFNSILLQPR